jgi:hypothetical protein
MTSKLQTKTFHGCSSCVLSLAFGTCLRSFRLFATLPRSEIRWTQRLKAEFQHWKNGVHNRSGGLRRSKRNCHGLVSSSGVPADANAHCAPDLRSLDNIVAASGVRTGSFPEKLSDCSPRFQGCKLWEQIMCPRDVQALHQEAKADAIALRSEIGQLREAIDAAECPVQEAQKHSPEAAQKQHPRPRAQHPACGSFHPLRRSSTISAGNDLCFCGEEAATVSRRETFTGVATATRTH